MKLDGKGRCCGRKPLVYKKPPAHKFCTRCDRAYDLITGEQVANWAWRAAGPHNPSGGGFERRAGGLRAAAGHQ